MENSPIKQVGDYQISTLIGKGAFASVYKATHCITEETVAIKIFPKSTLRTKANFELLRREVQFLKALDHPYIASFYDVIDDESSFYLVQEYVENGSLLDYINHQRSLSEEESRRIFLQLVSVLQYLHIRCHIIHRDLKPENILLDRHNNIRLIDFGLSKAFTKEDPYFKTTCGSPGYIAPEIIQEHPYDSSADIWSSGILLYGMVLGHLPFSGKNISQLLDSILHSDPVIPETLSSNLRRFLSHLLSKDPNERPSLDEILADPWILEADANLRARISNASSLCILSLPPDQFIISQVKALNLDTTNLSKDIQCGNVNSAIAAYRILKTQQIVEELDGNSKSLKKAMVTRSIKVVMNLPPLFNPADDENEMSRPLSPTSTNSKPAFFSKKRNSENLERRRIQIPIPPNPFYNEKFPPLVIPVLRQGKQCNGTKLVCRHRHRSSSPHVVSEFIETDQKL